jgi:hypothetical protein
MPRPNDAERAAARGRASRGNLLFLVLLLMTPASVALSCGGAVAVLPPQDRAFGLLPAVVLPVVFLIAAFSARRLPRAAKAELVLIDWADENGLAYRRQADAGKPAADRVYRMGGEVARKYHMTGDVGGTRVEFVNRWSRTGFGDVIAVEAEQTEAAVVGAVPAGWDVAVIPKPEMAQVHDLTRGERVRFRDDPEFDRAFVVYSEVPDPVEVGLPARFRDRCLDRPEDTVVVRGGTLVVFRLNYVCGPAGYDELLDHALALAAALA